MSKVKQGGTSFIDHTLPPVQRMPQDDITRITRWLKALTRLIKLDEHHVFAVAPTEAEVPGYRNSRSSARLEKKSGAHACTT